jgi:hypothetical protein
LQGRAPLLNEIPIHFALCEKLYFNTSYPLAINNISELKCKTWELDPTRIRFYSEEPNLSVANTHNMIGKSLRLSVNVTYFIQTELLNFLIPE